MILAVDIGNTNVSLGYVNDSYDVLHEIRLPTNSEWTTGEYEAKIRERLLGIPDYTVSGVIMASVVPAVQTAISACIRSIFQTEPQVVGTEMDFGFAIDVQQPDRVGKDRFVDSAWAAANYPLPVVTVDMGTATTFNVISKDKVFCGGVIAAGIMTGLKALASRTAQLPELTLQIPDHIIGRNTAECMMTGAVAGTAALVDGIATDIEEELGCDVTLIITGGGARFTDGMIRHKHIWEPDMMLKGLAYLYTRINL